MRVIAGTFGAKTALRAFCPAMTYHEFGNPRFSQSAMRQAHSITRFVNLRFDVRE